MKCAEIFCFLVWLITLIGYPFLLVTFFEGGSFVVILLEDSILIGSQKFGAIMTFDFILYFSIEIFFSFDILSCMLVRAIEKKNIFLIAVF